MTESNPTSANSSAAISIQKVAIIGGGPAGLMAAEVLIDSGVEVDLYESMPTIGRKFLRAGLGGLNLTHSESYEKFCTRYGDVHKQMKLFVDEFPPEKIRNWVHELGIETFVGSSGRIFPQEMKAAPLLRKWVNRLRNAGVNFHVQHSWLGINDDASFQIKNPEKEFSIKPDAIILALGGASWPQLGSTGTWVPWLKEHGVEITDWQSANCGFNVSWSDHLKEKFSFAPLKAVSLTFTDLDGITECKPGEMLISEYGLEGSLIYTFSYRLREYLNKHDKATIFIDLLPDRSFEQVLKTLSRPRGKQSISRHLKSCIGNNALKRALLYEVLSKEQLNDPSELAKAIKALPIEVNSPRPLEEAISSAGGITLDSMDENLMLKKLPGVFVAGEMIDWEAPTGGYLLTGCFATGRWAGLGAKGWVETRPAVY